MLYPIIMYERNQNTMAQVCIINTTSDSDSVMLAHLQQAGLISDGDDITVIDQSDLNISDSSTPMQVIGAVDGLLNAEAPLNSDPIFAHFEDGKLVSWEHEPDTADAQALHDEAMQLKQKMEQARSTRSSIRRSLPMRYDLFDAFATHTIETINWFGYEPMDAPDELDGDHELYVKPHGNGVFAYVDINDGKIDAFLIRPMVFGNGGMQVNVSDLQSTMQVAGRELINLFDSIRPFGTANVSGKDVLISPLA